MSDIGQHLIEQVKTAREQGFHLNIIGRGSKQFLGRTPVGTPISIAEHCGIVDYRPAELVITARAGTLLSEIEAALAQHGQMLPFEPPTYGGRASLGGTLACNLSGPARPWRGSIRDVLLGVRLINGKGEHLRFGGQVIKNVAGYDVSRLHAGAMGTLAIITEVTLRVVPKPAASLTLRQDMDAEQAIRKMNALAAEAKPLTGACWVDDGLYLRLSGTRSAVNTARAKWGGEFLDSGDRFWHGLREMRTDFFVTADTLWRFSVKPTAGHFYQSGVWLIDWAGALRWLNPERCVEDLGRVEFERAAELADGQTMMFRGGDRNEDVFHSQSRTAQLIHERLKSAFDPDRLFNPGRLYSWL